MPALESIQQWIYKHPKTTFSLLAVSLVTIGVIIGLTLASNVYDDGMTQMFKEAAEKYRPVVVGDRWYSITDLGDSGLANDEWR